MNNIEIFFEDIQPFNIQNIHIQKIIKELIISELKIIGNLSVIFCSDKYLLDMNKQYLNHNYYTDIITFDYAEENIISGDLFISFERIVDNAKVFNSELIKEVYRVIFHGILHLVGYNDKTEKEQNVMTEKENFYLSKVDFSGKEI